MQHAEIQTAKKTRFAPGTAAFDEQKKLAVKQLLQDSFGILAKSPHSWARDQSYFFNRRSEQGFGRGYNTSPEFLATLFGSAYIDMIYPKWWGGQGRVSDTFAVQKVSEKQFEPGTNCAHEIFDKREFLKATRRQDSDEKVDRQLELRPADNLQETKRPAYHKPQVDPGLLPVAGKASVAPRQMYTQRAFDPSSFYGENSGFNRWKIQADTDYQDTLRKTHESNKHQPCIPEDEQSREGARNNGRGQGYNGGWLPREKHDEYKHEKFGEKAKAGHNQSNKPIPNLRPPIAGHSSGDASFGEANQAGRDKVGAVEVDANAKRPNGNYGDEHDNREAEKGRAKPGSVLNSNNQGSIRANESNHQESKPKA